MAARQQQSNTDQHARKIINVLDPTSAQDAATKAYVDITVPALSVAAPPSVVPGDPSTPGAAITAARGDHSHGFPTFGTHVPVRVATTGNISLIDIQTIDGILLASDDRVLVKNQNTVSQNGLYVVVDVDDAPTWDRASDAIDPTVDTDLQSGDTITVLEGTVNAQTQWRLTKISPVIIGTSPLTFALVSAPTGTPGNSAVGDAAAPGTASLFIRSDHKHGREAFAAPVAQTTYNAPTAPGTLLTVPHSDHTHGTPAHTAAIHQELIASTDLTDVLITAPATGHALIHNGTQFVNSDFDTRVRTSRLDQLTAPTVDLSVNNHKLINVLDPTGATDATNKQYVDAVAAGTSPHTAVRMASTVNIATLSGLLVVDGVTAIAADRVLVKDQTTQSQNGIYAANASTWTRATDADASGELKVGATVLVTAGTTQAGQQWVMNTAGAVPWVPGTSTSTWALNASAVSFGIPGTSAVADAAAAGAAVTAARSDHKHGRESFGTVTTTTGYGMPSNSGAALTVSRSDHVHGDPALTALTPSTQAIGDTAVVGSGTAPAKEDHKHAMPAFGNVTAVGVGDVAANGTATTISHSDHNHGMPAAVSGGARVGVRAVSTVDIFLSGGHVIDGVLDLIDGDRVLVVGQDDATQNGIYTVLLSGTWPRATDSDSITPDVDFKSGAIVPVLEGAEHASSLWVLANLGSITIGTTLLDFHKIEEVYGLPDNSRVGDSASTGTDPHPARSDHVHGREPFGPVIPVVTPGQASTDGVASSVSRSDHFHGSASLATTPASNQAIGDSASIGTGIKAAHADHMHGMPTFGAVSTDTAPGATQVPGTASTISHSDHAHGMVAYGIAANIAVGDGAAIGSADLLSRSDHHHGFPGFGNATATQTFGSSPVNGTATTLSRSDHTHGTPTHTAGAHQELIALNDLTDASVASAASGQTLLHNGTQFVNSSFDARVRLSTLNQMAAPTADLSAGGQKLIAVADPVSATDAANKSYVDAARVGISPHAAVRVASTANVTVASPGAAIDGVTLAATDRVLLKNQTTTTENGIYTFNSSATPLTRATDADASGELVVGTTVFVTTGTQSGGQQWMMLTSPVPWVPGSSATTWTQNSSTAAYGSVIPETLFGQVAANGVLAAVARADHTHGSASLTANTPNPWTAGGAGIVGTDTAAAHGDHRHAAPGYGPTVSETVFGTTPNDGVATTLARSDHTHGSPSLTISNPANEDLGVIAAVGVATTAARSDHVHRMPTMGTTAGTVAAGNHTHATYVTKMQVEVDFGLNDGGLDTTMVKAIAATWVSATSTIIITNAGLPTADHADPAEAAVDGMAAYAMNLVVGVGFDLIAYCATGAWGRYLFNIVAS